MNVNSRQSAERLKEWALLFDEQQQSGLTVKGWCEHKCISTGQFYRWRQKLLLSLLPAKAQVSPIIPCGDEKSVVFAEVSTHLRPVAGRQSRPPVICVKCPKCDVVIEAGMDKTTIQNVLSALEVVC